MWDTKQPLHYGYSWDLRVECLLQWRHWVTSWNQAWSRPSYLATGRFPLWRKQRAWVLALCCMDTGRVKGFGGGGWIFWGQIQSCEGEREDVVDRNILPPLEPRSPVPRRFCPRCLVDTESWLAVRSTYTASSVCQACQPCVVRTPNTKTTSKHLLCSTLPGIWKSHSPHRPVSVKRCMAKTHAGGLERPLQPPPFSKCGSPRPLVVYKINSALK